ncbi:unnamed protein product [Protopolystoma xenopodis]|uniref:Uncharacterized protein n=1 Tax=Protopolystoma xenopodis TaxID=117903 RepID=A0A448WVG7_9PLAT|nr:unnamed protein product [Protopolystoma xenopodis]
MLSDRSTSSALRLCPSFHMSTSLSGEFIFVVYPTKKPDPTPYQPEWLPGYLSVCWPVGESGFLSGCCLLVGRPDYPSSGMTPPSSPLSQGSIRMLPSCPHRQIFSTDQRACIRVPEIQVAALISRVLVSE